MMERIPCASSTHPSQGRGIRVQQDRHPFRQQEHNPLGIKHGDGPKATTGGAR